MEIFYEGLNRPSQSVADASATGGLMNKTYMQVKDILDRISRNTDEWVDYGYGSRSTDRRRKQAGMLETDVLTNLLAQMATMTYLLKTIALNNQGIIKVDQLLQ